MSGSTGGGGAVVIYLARHRSRRSGRRDLWLVALAAGALVALLLALARPFDARAGPGSEASPSVLAD
jgi:hypothetical protein